MDPRAAVSGPRRLLRRLRDIMASPRVAQERLDQIAGIIAADMVAEVCSVYLMRAGEVLELFASEGLSAAAVHNTRLRVGEGLVGAIAATAHPLNLSDAQAHPDFVYREETGEEIYHAFLGVPILRAGRVAGVLVVQNRTRRHYTEEELEAMQIVAMVLAELVGAGELVRPEEILPADGIALLPLRLEGVRLNTGLGIGHAQLHQQQITVDKLLSDDPEAELERLRAALAEMHSALDDMLDAQSIDAGEHRDILETYRMFAQDRGWLRRLKEAVANGLTAEAAVQKVQEDTRVRMGRIADSYLRERLADLDDLAFRLLQHLSPGGGAPNHRHGDGDIVLFARNMGPAELLDYQRVNLRALVLEEGSPTSHVSIVARALDIPVLGQVGDVLSKVASGDPVIVDGDNGQMFIRPGEDIQQAFGESMAARARRRAEFAALRDLPAVTRDGMRVGLNINAGLLIDLQALDEFDADGVGLYRTEIPFMVRSDFPDVEAQTDLYRRVLDQCADKPVVFRTLDIGGDKALPYWRQGGEENPAMGWRAIRIGLDRPAILRSQLRAIVGAGAGRRIGIMFPMVAEVAEFDAARRVLDLAVARLSARGSVVPAEIRIGVMLEVPALVWQLPALLDRVDFVSVGSNDFFQFLFASDRGNPRLAERYDVLSPAALRCLDQVVTACSAANVPVSLCGEMAGRPLEAMVLLALGFRSLSMTPTALGEVKSMVRSLDLGVAGNYVRSLLDLADHSLRGKIRSFALDHGVSI
ncbi:MAG: phosphoenolpyruvate--protein phosphotransferase [Alphaproteobacteria bacterium]